jgi:putative inorganic carbon (HCO3(-)) transporter
MPLYLLRFSIFGIPTTVLEMMIYILFLIWIINKIQKHYLSFPRRRKPIVTIKKNSILNVGIILLFFGVIISTALSSDLRASLGIFKGWFVDPFLFFVVFTSVIKKEKHIILVLKSWLASGVVVSLISIFYLLNNSLTFDGRLKAFFLSPNHLAMYLAPAFLIGLFFLLNNLSFLRRQESTAAMNNSLRIIQTIKKIFNIQHLIFIVIISIPLYFTYSYGAFLGIFIGALYLVLKNKKLKIRNFYLVGFIFLILSGFIFITTNKFNQIINSDNRSSFHSRLMIWDASVEIIKDNPLLGIGPGTFQDAYLSYSKKFNEPYLEWAVPQPHNIFLAFYLQTGIIGSLGFILILIWFFSCRRDEALPRLYWQVINVLMIYILVHGLIDTTYWKNDLSLMFWLLVGMKVILYRMPCDKNSTM